MVRRRANSPLKVLINNRMVGWLTKENSGAIGFRYDNDWLDWPHAFAISLSLPMRETAYAGAPVLAVFDNLLPDNPDVRRRVAERIGASGPDPYSLLEIIGRDCVGAMQFLPEGADIEFQAGVRGERVSDKEIEEILSSLASAPLGMDKDQDFRISVAGAQEKTALLRYDNQWLRPTGSSPTTHILKPQLGEIPTAFGMIDMTASVDNEHYCLTLMQAFGLQVAKTEIATFGAKRVLVVERFDRRWRNGEQLLRLPQEDCCQALGVASTRKYQAEGGPGMVDILRLLQRSDEPLKDQAAFFKSQILFWLFGATDGHGKNFSIFLKPEGRYGLTPFYDVLSAQPAFDKKQITFNKYKLAMSVGKAPHYRIRDVVGRYYVQTGKAAGLGAATMKNVITEIMDRAPAALDEARAMMPADFSSDVHDAIASAMPGRLKLLETAFAEF